MANTKHVLVTGRAGYIRSVVGAQLLAAGRRVSVLDNLNRGHREAAPAGAELVTGDVSDRARLDTVFARRKVDAVLQFAALIEVGESMREPERYFRNNSAGTLTLLEAMRAHGTGQIVYSSTAARGRPGGAGGQLRKNPARAGRGAQVLGPGNHHRQRVGVAPKAPARIRRGGNGRRSIKKLE